MKIRKILCISTFILSLVMVGTMFLPALTFPTINGDNVYIPFYTLIFGGSVSFDTSTIYFDLNIWLILCFQLIILTGLSSLLGINKIGNIIFSLILSIASLVFAILIPIFINIVNPSFLLNDVSIGIGLILVLVLSPILITLNIFNLIVRKLNFLK